MLLCLSAGLFGCGDAKESSSKNDETTTAVTTAAETTEEKETEAEAKAEAEAEVSIKLEDGRIVMDLSDEYSEFIAYLDKVEEFSEIPEDEEMSFSFSTEGEAEFELDASDIEITSAD